MATSGVIQKQPPYITAQAQLEQRWQALAADPAQQALACAALCLAEAPQLAAWLKAKILADIPDRELAAILRPPVTDGRILAYNQLCQIATPTTTPQPSRPPAPPPVKAPPKRAGQGGQNLTPFQQNYQHIFGVVPETVPDIPPTLRVEPEIGRVCIGLYKAGEYRLYVIARELTRSGDGSGKVSKKALKAALRRYGIDYTRRHLSRLLQTGEGVFWNLSRTTLYLRSIVWLGARLAELAPELHTTNRPGVRDVYLSPAGTLEQWEAMLYAGWCAHRGNPTIARATLETLFNRSQDTLRRWEQTCLGSLLTIRHNDVQCPHPLIEDDRYTGYVPEHSQAYVAHICFQGEWQQQVRLRWRTSNTYQIKGIRQHLHRGQASKARKAVNAILEHPAIEKRGGRRPLKRYFDNPRHLKDYTAKHHSVGYLWRGENRLGQGIFEISSTGFWFTRANERVSPQQERRYFMMLG